MPVEGRRLAYANRCARQTDGTPRGPTEARTCSHEHLASALDGTDVGSSGWRGGVDAALLKDVGSSTDTAEVFS